ncbi:MAG: glycosyltransferase family 4 protein [Patescibacteria group bacterium]|jgi:glycosyltransferase involved in cell wall biosynthesis|nr:glycosyltransferase family 4 protein [Patescibacteria group bacterium]
MDKNKTKILFITRNRSKRGGHVVLVNLVCELRKQGYDTTLTTFKPEGEIDFPDCERLWNGVNPDIVTIPSSEKYDEQILIYTKEASRYLKNNIDKYDRVVLDSWHIAHAAIKAGVISDKVFHFVQSDPEFTPEDNSKIWKAEFFSLLPLYKSQKIFVSNSLAHLFQSRYGVKGDVLNLFIDEEYFRAKKKVEKRSTINIISSSADFNMPEKGLDVLLEKLSQFNSFPFKLTLVSGRPIKKDLIGFPFEITETSSQEPKEMVELFLKNDVYINTSTNESFCLVLAEALAVGMPAIALDSNGNRDYMDGSNAIFIRDANMFNDGLPKMADYEFREILSRNAKNSMVKYKIENTVNQFKEIIGI